jgi:hypothetical protein
MNNELEKIWGQSVMAYFKAKLPGGAGKSQNILYVVSDTAMI